MPQSKSNPMALDEALKVAVEACNKMAPHAFPDLPLVSYHETAAALERLRAELPKLGAEVVPWPCIGDECEGQCLGCRIEEAILGQFGTAGRAFIREKYHAGFDAILSRLEQP